MLDVTDVKAVISQKAKAKIERMETRLTRYYGRFMELPIEILASLVNHMPDEKVFNVPKPPGQPTKTPEEVVAKMSRGLVEIELEKRGFKFTGEESTSELRELLIISAKESQAEKEKEAV